MKQILVMMAAVVLVGCEKFSPPVKIANPIIEESVRISLQKPRGKLTEADLRKVTGLDLSLTTITDAGFKEVAKLQKLEVLNLKGTEITNAGIKELAKLQNLEWLSVQNSQITFAGVYELLGVLPNCTIPLDKLPDTNKTHKSKTRKSKTP